MGAAEEDESTTTTAVEKHTTQSRKQYTRHHIKRRSSGRVHVTKLAPMAKVNAENEPSDADDATEPSRPPIRRSQSQKSLHRLSSDKKGFVTRRKSNASAKQPFIENLTTIKSPSVEEQQQQQQQQEHKSSNPALLSDRVVAAPVEQTLNAVANNLVVPKISDKEESSPKKQLLKSQFVSPDEERSPHKTPSTSSFQINRNHKLSRTQQKLMLQRQQAQIEDETSPIHPKNIQRLNKELELVGKEYKCIKRYQDPIRLSLSRCLLQQNPDETQTYIPHLEQRQIAHRHHHLKTIALSRAHQQQHKEEHDSYQQYGLLSSFIDKVFHNKS